MKLKPEYIGVTLWAGSPYSQNVIIADDTSRFPFYKACGFDYIFIEEEAPIKKGK